MLLWAHIVNYTMRSYCLVVTQAKHFSELHMPTCKCPLPNCQSNGFLIKHIQFVSKNHFFCAIN